MAASNLSEEESRRLLGYPPAAGTRRSSRHRSCGWWLSPLRLFGRGRAEPIPVCKPKLVYLDATNHKRVREERMRALQPGHFKRLAWDRRLVMECLSHYNSLNPHMEYEPAPGEVWKNTRLWEGFTCTHGNFVARRKRSGCCFPFLPAPRTLFFFELTACSRDSKQVVTCTPLFDEEVTEGYSILGFRIWRGTRRIGMKDCICKTCFCRYDSPDEPLACGHNGTECICEMCYGRHGVLHPFPGLFEYGYRASRYDFD